MEVKAGQIYVTEWHSRTWLVRVVRVTGRFVTFRKCNCVGYVKSHHKYHTERLEFFAPPKFQKA